MTNLDEKMEDLWKRTELSLQNAGLSLQEAVDYIDEFLKLAKSIDSENPEIKEAIAKFSEIKNTVETLVVLKDIKLSQA